MDKNTKDISVTQINKNLGKLDETYMSESLLAKMTGEGTFGTVPEDKSITSIKLASKSIKANNTDIQISTRDLFEGEPIEVLVGNHGFGGMQTEDSWCLNQIGYFYLDKDSKSIYIFNIIIRFISPKITIIFCI